MLKTLFLFGLAAGNRVTELYFLGRDIFYFILVRISYL